MTCWGLVPLESFLLGDQADKLIAEKKSVINDLFSYRQDNLVMANLSHKDPQLMSLNKKKVAYMRGLYEGGKKLKNFCQVNNKISYASLWQKEQVKRTVISTLQFIGLDYTVKALAQYAQFFQFSESDYKNLVKRLVGGYCSHNLTVISLKQLEKNFSAHFSRKLANALPNINNNPLFNKQKLLALHPHEESLQREFLKTVEVFKALCSWGNDTENLRLIYPFLRNPVVMSFIIRQMSGVQLQWRAQENRFIEVDNPHGVHITCENLICRKTSKDRFLENLPKALGQNAGPRSDFARLYCEEFKNLKKVEFASSKKIHALLKGLSLDDEKLAEGQLLALISQTPDFFVRAESMQEGPKIARSGLDHLWDTWAAEQLGNHNKDIYYEEPLSIEVVDRSFYFNKLRPKFKVVFDINLGEFDRLNQFIGKIKTNFKVRLSTNFLAWIRRKWAGVDPRRPQDRESLLTIMNKHLIDDVHKSFAKLLFPALGSKMEELIGKEILQQLLLYRGDFFVGERAGFVDIPVQLQFGTFALKYIHYVHQAKKNKRGWSLSAK